MTHTHNILRQTLLTAAALCLCTTLFAQQKITRDEYIAQWADVAIEQMEEYGIPASITMAQAIVESGSGNGVLARTANNHFGIKCGGVWKGEVVYHDDDAAGECFRSYETARESFDDHAEFLNTRSRYQFLFDYAADDYVNWAKGLKQAGYATAPTYAESLINVIESERLYLLDQKNGRQLYDDYVAEKLGLNKPQEEVVEPQLNDEGLVDQTLAYADKSIDPNNFRVTINSHYGYNVYLTNGANYVIAREGDTYKSIGRLFDMPQKMLRKFNDVSSEAELKAGDIVYIERKASRWRGNNLIHRTESGESLHLISQIYGISLKGLMKLNRIPKGKECEEGTALRLR